jgi:hypothetical protein
MKRSIVFMGLMIVFFCGITYAAMIVPEKINVQGMATDNSGNPLTSPDDLTFKLYDVSGGGAPLWSTTINDYPFDHGLFNVELSIPFSEFGGSNRWLGVSIGVNPELSPRIQLISVPYAYKAQVAYSVESAPASGGGWMDDGTEVHLITGTDKVGIGTSAPAVKLHVTGGTDAEAGTANSGFFIIGSSTGEHLAFDNNEIMAKGSGTTSNTLYFQNDGGISSFEDLVWIRGDGSPTWPLSDEGMEIAYDPDVDRGYIRVYDRDANSWGELTLGLGNVGIGVTDPEARLHVKQAPDTPSPTLYVENNSSSSAPVVTIERTQNVPYGEKMLHIQIPSGSDRAFFIDCMRGTDFEFIVDRYGDVYADGSYTGPADFSEMIAVSSGAFTAEAGDVMVIDPKNMRSVVKSAEPRSTLVAGIYSTKPGFLGSERDWDKPTAQPDVESGTYTLDDMAKEFNEIPLAVVGIVPCKVSAENGAISPGDLLVTSSTPGHAMRDDNPKVGTVLGKALEPLTSGTGVIKVLVSLH